MKSFYTFLKQTAFFLLTAAFLIAPGLLSACDTSGFTMDGITDNGDGTFTINWTVLVAGGTTTSVGSTWGFYLNIDAQILSINPPSFTSANGTTLNAVINGGTVEWGDPDPSSDPPFLNIATEFTDQWFPFTMVIQGIPSEWWGGGQEANMCPGGPGTNMSNYEGVFPCFEPEVTPVQGIVHICPGETATLTVVTNYLTETVTWSPGGQTGNTISVSPSQTTVYTVTAANSGCETTAEITVIIDPLPLLTPVNSQLEGCEDLPVVLDVIPQYVDIITWNPGNISGTSAFLIVIPTTSPSVYTATGSNNCGEITVEFTVTTSPPPTINIVNDTVTICEGESITLVANTTNANLVAWSPGNTNGNTLVVSPGTTTEYTAVATSDCGLDVDSVTVIVASGVENEIELEACYNESVMYNGIPLQAGSTSTFTFNSYQGCDSVVTVIVNELMAASTELELETCQGTNVVYDGQSLAPGSVTVFTFAAANGCDSVVTVTVTELPEFSQSIQLEACEGDSASYNGQSLLPGSTTEFTFQTLAGCDSLVSVTVDELPTYSDSLTLQTCTGSTISYNGQQLAPGSVTGFTFSSVAGCDSMVTVTVEELPAFSSSLEFATCPGTTVSYNGQQLAPSSVTDFSFTTANGCDSIVTVTVTEVAAIAEELEFDACTGTSISYNGDDLLPGSVTEFTFMTSQGCDSIVTVTVNELPAFSSSLTLQACTGTTAIYNGQSLAPGSVTGFTLAASNGCDSVVTVTVEETGISTTSLQLETCTGTTVSYNSQQLGPGSVTDFTFTSTQGCDSVVTVTVTELPIYNTTLELQACSGSTALYNGINLPPGTVINFTFDAFNGCDSVVNVTVTEADGFEENIELAACPGSTVSYNGQNLPVGSVTGFTFTSSIGCDSVVTVTVNELPVFTSALTIEACTGSTAVYNGTPLSPGSTTDFTLAANNGCDSIVTVTVNEVPILAGNLELQACEGSSVVFNGQSLPAGSVTDFTFTSSQGCDSIVTVTVNEVPLLASSLQLQACPNSTVSYAGQNLQPGSVTDFTFTSSQGCDSIVTVTVIEFPVQNSTLQLSACEGSFAIYLGQVLLPGTVIEFTVPDSNGCNSIVTVTVEALPGATGAVTLQGCQGEPLFYQGTEILPGTSQDFTFTASNSCDSIVTVTALPPVPVVNTSQSVDICEGATAVIFGQEVSAPGAYSQTFTGSNGCDSTHTVTLSISNNLLLDFPGDITVELGEPVVLNPTVWPPTGLTFNWQDDPALSCLDCLNPTATPPETTTFTLTISDTSGCQATASQLVFVEFSPGVYIPNAFSPNNDGINDLFMIFSDGKSVANVNSFLVFSRWGETVFEFHDFQPDDPYGGWDGTYRGDPLDPAVFTWFAEVVFIDGSKKLFKGDVTLVR
ncbi:MAG: gliding motility-associated C-terminal domain-containing protein [Saprospiraceae bacterium]|nr:MAG: gliding motility-associated C-terminal domain-containing protein [Saprospiraceae bacterium]